MSKLNNETIRQQQKARKDFIELKKMQAGEIDAGPKPSEIEIKPITPKEKFKHFWYYYGKITIALVLVAAVFAIVINQCASRIDYDLKVVYFSYTPCFDQVTEEMAKYFEKYGEDVNGDGEVHICVINCSYDKAHPDNAKLTKMQAMIVAEPNALLFIADSDSVKYFDALSKETEFFEDSQVALNEKFYEKTDEFSTLPKDLTVYIRNVNKKQINKNKDTEKYYDASKKLMENLK